MSHRLGPIITLGSPRRIGPDSGAPATGPNTWQENFSDPGGAGGTKFLMLHFRDATLTGGDRLEVDLGYDMDVFTAASGPQFYSRPVRGDSVTIRYIDDGVGVADGGVTLDRYGRGEGLVNGGADSHLGGNVNADVFLIDPTYDNPTIFNSNGVCPGGGSPSWENVACLPDGIMKTAARSTGMIIMEHLNNRVSPPRLELSSCSAALIDADLILTAAHCISTDDEAASGSFTLDFQTNCAGARPAGYNPKFYKMRRVVRTGFARPAGDMRPPLDYSIVQIDTGPSGIGVPPVSIRADAPTLGEQLFVIHHPRGATKKISRQPTDPTCAVNSGSSSTVLVYACDSDNGSSGSPVFDAMGRVVAVNDWAPGACNNQGQTGTVILQDFLTEPLPLRDVNVVAVFDRSGSMSLSGLSGTPKIQEARQAAALFISLLRTTASHQAGLVSFSTTPALDFGLAPVNATNKNTLIGPVPPGNSGVVGALSPGGSTTIGGGLRTAQRQLPAPGPTTNTPAILLMTDGLQNTPPMIEEVEAELGETRLCIIGFGSEANLDGPLLTRLARAHDGLYTRAGEGLELKKFFVLCFGNIFETGISLDPISVIPAGATEAEAIRLGVCGEESLTVVLGWEHAEAGLILSLVTPAGDTITQSTPGVEGSSGDTWAYLRLQLPLNGQRDGNWQVRVSRPGGDPEFSPSVAERFFVTSVIDGGPYFRPLGPRRYYTGDVINPLVRLLEPSGAKVAANVTVEVERPQAGTGNILTETSLQDGQTIDGDSLDARSSTLIALEQEQAGSLIPTATESFPLFDDGDHQDGAFEPDGVFGNPLEELARFEGNYTFRAQAVFGEVCTTSRETSWSVYVSVGIDPNATEVESQTVTTLPDGRERVQITFTPRDRYANYLGPGRLGSFEVAGQPGSELSGGVRDVGDGSYVQEVVWDPASRVPPGVAITQPERPPVGLCPPADTVSRRKWWLWVLLLVIAVLVLAILAQERERKKLKKAQKYWWKRLFR
jgi:hypothetical protein